MRNPNALSEFIPNEEFLDHTERKSTQLPCGNTVAESWGGLRRSWLGFKIAHSNGDSEMMTHYASFIKKVHTELGIQVTQFDSDILDNHDLNETDTCMYSEQIPEEKIVEEERCSDYDTIMEEARTRMNGITNRVAGPREVIFGDTKKKSNRNS